MGETNLSGLDSFFNTSWVAVKDVANCQTEELDSKFLQQYYQEDWPPPRVLEPSNTKKEYSGGGPCFFVA